MLDIFKKQFEHKKTWVIIKEGGVGLECFADNDLKRLSLPNKLLLKAFLEGVITELSK